MPFLRTLAVLSLLSYLLLPSQAPSGRAPQPFEVASIRPHNPKLVDSTISIPARGEISIWGMTLRNLIKFAYNLRDYQLSVGPKWLDSDKYDIRAKASEQSEPASGRTGTNDLDDQKVRMQLLLADRFGLKFHHGTRQEPVYFLTVAKTGLKMQAATNEAKPSNKGSIILWPLVVTDLSMRVGRPIVDETSLTGAYYVKLRYIDDDGRPVGIGTGQFDESDGGSVPSLFTAIQEQLGLRLQSGKGPITVMIIDSVNRPSEN
jgi:uncharacterized protein (TIGR03435 family)